MSQRNAEIVRLRRQGLTLAEIGQRIGISMQAVHVRLRSLGMTEIQKRKGTKTQHGTYGRYVYGCRCEPCREANRIKHQRLRVSKPFAHGYSGYQNYNCRCKICREAAAEHMRIEWESGRQAARAAVGRAIRAKQIFRPTDCERCGSGRSIHAHHADYDKPLAVEWLCASCHRQHHVAC